MRGARLYEREEAFGEALYEHLRAAPWWLLSAGLHGLGFLLLSALVGRNDASAFDVAIISTDIAPPTIEPEEPIEPERERNPVDEPLDPPDPTVIEDSDIEPPIAAEDAADVDGEPDLPAGIFEGKGENERMGIGGGPKGGGGRITRGRRVFRDVAPKEALRATDAALRWLARHQSPDGRWDCDGFERHCTGTRCGGPGGPLHDAGVTGLSLLAFLCAGETHITPTHGRVVRNALKYLKGAQDAEGCFGPRTGGNYVYDHAIAALAMSEAYGVTQSPLFRRSAQSGVDFVLAARNPYAAWRYGVRPQDNDTSVTGWMVMVLKSAAGAGLAVDPAAFEGAVAHLDRVTEPEYGRAGYTARGNGPSRPLELIDRFPADRSESLTAVAVLTRIFCGAKPDDAFVRKGADLMMRCLPVHDEAAGTVDHYYWYYGSLAMFQVGAEPWARWRAAMEKAILGSQRLAEGDDRHGSWDPVDPWAKDGGRVYSTAINALSSEVYYRHARVFGIR